MQLRITKYDPKYRDANGFFTKKEWIAISDIGKVYDGKIFTTLDYFQVEDVYCETVRLLLLHLKIKSMNILQCSARKMISDFFTATQYYSITEEFNDSLISGKKCTWQDMNILIRACLRGNFSCFFRGSKGTYLHFGYDYYMYFGSQIDLDLNKIAFPEKIFIEENFPSPYMDIKRSNKAWL
ncbi:MAG: hypothetical protein LBG58_00555 [Planctomycetaceae bacterium]|jgi:hypothetical protein|nr:hypothetical protein [Planctomycetaceae bacterium]